MAADVPGKLTPDNPYLTNPRVSAVRVSGYIEAGGASGSKYSDSGAHYEYYTQIYNRLSASDVWNSVKDKLYFYNTDEPLPVENVGNARHTVEDAVISRKAIDKFWGGKDPRIVIPHGENHPYPYWTFTNDVVPLSSYSASVLTDAEEKMLTDNLCTVWCPRMYGFTPMSEIRKTDYTGKETSIIRTNSGPYSGNIMKWANDYYIWEDIYGEFTDRVKSDMATDDDKIELWAYSAGFNKGYTYTNHLIENTGLQTKMMFWQLYQEDCTGYLYYGTNNWSEQDSLNGNYYDSTVTGGNIMCQWKTNKWYLGSTGKYIYGNGVLFYGANQAKMRGVTGCVGSIRVEMMRDGVEEYQMLTMIEDYLGEKAAKDIVARVSANVVNYLSMPDFSTSQWDAEMSEYDIMAQVRIDMGNTLEAAVVEGKCRHTYDEGKVTKEATCLEIGYKTYTCTKCNAQYDEYIPALHNEGSCFTVISASTATCESDGKVTMKCTVCGFVKERTTVSFHNDADYMRYEISDTRHSVFCTVCNEKLNVEEHTFFHYSSEPTCEEDGVKEYSCKKCGFAAEKEILEKTGHSYEEGCCTSCGSADPDYDDGSDDYIVGDIDGDGKINAKDANLLKRIVSGTLTPTDFQRKTGDINGDGTLNAIDANLITRLAAGSN